jgi:hypothetical protein
MEYCLTGEGTCVYMDGTEAGVFGDSSLFISTYFNTSVQKVATPRVYPKTPWHTTEGTPTLYWTADIANYYITIRHSVQQIDLGLSAQSRYCI